MDHAKSPTCVLVVDDDDDLRQTVSQALESAGYEVRQAVDGKDALRQLDGMPGEPCLVLLDMMMPQMNGAEMLRALDQAHRLATLPVVVVSGDAPDPGRARQLLRKPVSMDTLLRVVEEYCGKP
jgi:CheY-like chemotaxis protein